MMLKPSKTIAASQWMSTQSVRKLMDVLNDDSSEMPQALFVGGCVRNWLLDQPVNDIDVATVFTPEQVIERCNAHGIKTIPTGIDHGTVTAVIEGDAYEITTLRRDIETDGRRAVVAYTDDWVEDANRRDFTMNTLLADTDGNVFDPTGQGIDDLNARRVIFVGDADQRIAEDYLRILRFFRFHGTYGEGDADLTALHACRNGAQGLKNLSKERIAQEIFKILGLDQCADIINLMLSNSVLSDLFESYYKPEFLNLLCDLQSQHGLVFIQARFLVLCGLSFDVVQDLNSRIQMSNRFLKTIKDIVDALDMYDFQTLYDVRRCVYQYGRDVAGQCVLIAASYSYLNDGSDIDSAINVLKTWDVPVFDLSGDDLIAEGYERGPELGAELKRREQVWIEESFKD